MTLWRWISLSYSAERDSLESLKVKHDMLSKARADSDKLALNSPNLGFFMPNRCRKFQILGERGLSCEIRLISSEKSRIEHAFPLLNQIWMFLIERTWMSPPWVNILLTCTKTNCFGDRGKLSCYVNQNSSECWVIEHEFAYSRTIIVHFCAKSSICRPFAGKWSSKHYTCVRMDHWIWLWEFFQGLLICPFQSLGGFWVKFFIVQLLVKICDGSEQGSE